MRLEGVEPPRSCLHGDLNAARLPVPPQPRDRPVYRRSLATLRPANSPLSSRGLGRRPLTAETGVRIPVAVLPTPRERGAFCVLRPSEHLGQAGRGPLGAVRLHIPVVDVTADLAGDRRRDVLRSGLL